MGLWFAAGALGVSAGEGRQPAVFPERPGGGGRMPMALPARAVAFQKKEQKCCSGSFTQHCAKP